MTDAALTTIAPSLRRLTSLRTPAAGRVTGPVWARVLAHLRPTLLAVDLSGCGGVTSECVAVLARQAPGLRLAHLGRTGVADAGVRALVAGCPGLTTLSLRGCTEVVGLEPVHLLAGGCLDPVLCPTHHGDGRTHFRWPRATQ